MAERETGRMAARAAAAAVAVVLVVTGAAACQPAPVPPRPPTPRPPITTTTTTVPVPASTVLEVTYRPSGSGGGSLTYTVRCGPGAAASVTPPMAGIDAGRACDNAETERTLLVEGPPTGRVCIQQYFGPQTARVTGHVDGSAVDRRLSRSNGCVEHDWYRVRHIVPLPPARASV